MRANERPLTGRAHPRAGPGPARDQAPPDPSTSLGVWLRARRLAAGLTQAEMARRVPCARVTVKKVEADERRPSEELARRLAQALGLTDDDRAALVQCLRDGVAAPRPPAGGPGPWQPPPGRWPGAHGLPVSLTSFVDRAADLDVVARLVRADRLVTLTGVGGVGKTRLALRAAATLAPALPDGVWFVDLALLANAADVGPAVLAALGLRGLPGQSPTAALVDALAPRQALLLLDNCEHLIDASACLVEGLLSACPGLRVLATSREPLGVPGEAVWRVPPLTAPPPGTPARPDDLTAYAAVQLFVERARAARPSFAVTEANAAAVAEVCRRLDGIPLALELAAARLSALPVEEVATRLGAALGLLGRGARTAPPRHRTLRAAIDWSHDLLPGPHRALLRRVAVFAGGFDAEAAEAVGAWPGTAAPDVLHLLLDLVDRSLVVAEDQAGSVRYRLLETIRQHALERLAEADEVESARSRHRDWCLGVAERGEQALLGSEMLPWLARLDREHDNLRAALRWSVEERVAAPALQLAAALWFYWRVRGLFAEGAGWCEAVLALPEADRPSAARAAVLVGAALMHARLGDVVRASARGEQALAAAREVGHARAAAMASVVLGGVRAHEGDWVGEDRRLRQGIAAVRETGDPWSTGVALSYLGGSLFRAGDLPAAGAALEEALALARQTKNPWLLAHAAAGLGQVAATAGDRTLARRRLEEALRGWRAIGAPQAVAGVTLDLGRLALGDGDMAAARALHRGALETFRDLRDLGNIPWALAECARLAAAGGEQARALRLRAAAERLSASLGDHLTSVGGAAARSWQTGAREALGPAASGRAWAEGEALTPDEAIALAMESASPPPEPLW